MWGADFLEHFVRVLQCFAYCQRVHLSSVLVTAGFDRALQIVSGNLNCERIGNRASGALLVFNPGWVRKRDPYWMIIDKEFNINGISVTGCHGNHQGLI